MCKIYGALCYAKKPWEGFFLKPLKKVPVPPKYRKNHFGLSLGFGSFSWGPRDPLNSSLRSLNPEMISYLDSFFGSSGKSFNHANQGSDSFRRNHVHQFNHLNQSSDNFVIRKILESCESGFRQFFVLKCPT
jgi:hypothetical protein